jgi:PadR family transcriptional regulator, regulatory protein AphA
VPAAVSVAVERLTTTEAAVLALLSIEGERSGYDLLKLAQQAIAQVWSPARSALFAVLPRLERAGLASGRTVTQSARPDKRVYAVTDAGRESLHAWLETVEPGARDTVFLKLFVGGLTTPDVLIAHVDQFVADTSERLEELRSIEPTNTGRGHDWHHRHLLRLGIEQAEGELAWAAGVRRALQRGPR